MRSCASWLDANAGFISAIEKEGCEAPPTGSSTRQTHHFLHSGDVLFFNVMFLMHIFCITLWRKCQVTIQNVT